MLRLFANRVGDTCDVRTFDALLAVHAKGACCPSAVACDRPAVNDATPRPMRFSNHQAREACE